MSGSIPSCGICDRHLQPALLDEEGKWSLDIVRSPRRHRRPSGEQGGRLITGNALLSRIEINPKVMLGRPVVRGTRITVEAILEKLAADIPIDEVIVDYPDLDRRDVLAAIAYARQVIETGEFVPRIAR